MAVIKVLLNDKGDVVGTAPLHAQGMGTAAPVSATLVPRSGQRLVEVTVDDKIARLKPAELHDAIKAKHLR